MFGGSLFYLVLIILGLQLYLFWRLEKVAGLFAAAIDRSGADIAALRASLEKPAASLLLDEWTAKNLKARPSKEEQRMKLQQPNPLANPDAFTEAQIMAQLNSRSAADRVPYLDALKQAGCWFNERMVGALLEDESPIVRTWVAENTTLRFRDYRDFMHPVEKTNYEPRVQSDPEPLVRASIWKNEDCSMLPWSMLSIADSWKEQLRGMTQIERLALIRNPEIQYKYVVALLTCPTEELGLTRKEHADILSAAATSERMVWGSRHLGREWWDVAGDPNPPFEEFGEMWQLSLDKWADMPFVPYAFLRFIQTTPKVKLATYQRLLTADATTKPQQLREVLLDGCDPLTDKDVLKVAWSDPDPQCKAAAVKRVGEHKKWVGVS